MGRAPAYIDLVRPLKDGVIQDHRMTNELIVRFVNEVCRSRLRKPRVAVCVPVPGKTLDENEIREWLEPRLARYKIPKRFVVWEEMPKSGYGKIVKRQLRDLLQEQA